MYIYVLASHKIVNPDKFELTRKVIKSIVHPNFNKPSLNNDIALLKLSEKLPTESESSRISAICQPETAKNFTGLATISGWKLSNKTDYVDKPLLNANVTVLKQSECLGFVKNMPANTICSNGKTVNESPICNHSPGAPLIAFDMQKNQWQLIGISSNSNKCEDNPLLPGVYTEVVSFLDWIRKTINEN